MGFAMLDCMARLRKDTGLNLSIRVGLASGPVTAGVIGTKKFSYDVWGDAVNLASRLEGLSAPGRILVCPSCRAKLGDAFAFESRGSIDIKGIGSQETWYLIAIGGEEVDEAVTPSDHLRTRSVS
jgi:adenylate cyclase